MHAPRRPDKMRGRMRTVGLAVVVVSTLSMAGCSRSASRDDCDRIITRSVELRAKEQKQTDPAVVEKAIADYKHDHAAEIESSCVGRSLPKDAMKCIERAETSDAVEACLY